MSAVDWGASGLVPVLLVGGLSGVLSVWAFRRWTDAEEVRQSVNRILAHLFEFQLFGDEPLLVLRAQRDLIIANGRLLRKLALPSALLTAPFLLLLVCLEAYVAQAPLRSGEATVVTAEFSPSAGPEWQTAELTAPGGMQVETPALRVPAERAVTWRVRPLRAAAGSLQVRWDGHAVAKSIVAGAGLRWLSDRRTGIAGTLLHPFEPPIEDAALRSIRLRYPAATIFRLPWLLWFVLGSCAGALLAFSIKGWAAPARLQATWLKAHVVKGLTDSRI